MWRHEPTQSCSKTSPITHRMQSWQTVRSLFEARTMQSKQVHGSERKSVTIRQHASSPTVRLSPSASDRAPMTSQVRHRARCSTRASATWRTSLLVVYNQSVSAMRATGAFERVRRPFLAVLKKRVYCFLSIKQKVCLTFGYIYLFLCLLAFLA